MNTLSQYTIIFLLIFISVNSQSNERKAEGIPGESLFSATVYYGFELSPSGTKLLFRYWTTDGIIVVVYDLDARKVKYSFKMPKGYNARDLSWLSNNSLVFEHKGMLIKMEENSANLEIMVDYVFDRNGSSDERRIKYWNFYHTLTWDDSTVLIQSFDGADSQLHHYNFITGEKTLLLDGRKLDIQEWNVDSLGNPKFGVRINDSTKDYFWVDLASGSIFPVVLPNGKPLQINRRNPKINHYKITAYGSSSRHLFISENATTGYFRLLEIDPKDGKIIRVLRDKIGEDFSYQDNNLALFFHPKTGELAGIRSWGDYYDQDWLLPEFETLQNQIDKLSPATTNIIRECDHDLRYCRVTCLNYSDTTEQRLLDSKTNELLKIYDWSKERKDYVVSTPEKITYYNKDIPIVGFLTNATHRISENTPFLIIPCNGPFKRHDNWFNNYAQFFSTRGFNVLQINMRSCRGYGQQHLFGNDGDLANNIASDLALAAEYINGKLQYKNTKIFLFSNDAYGSYAISLALKATPSKFDGAALFSAPLEPIKFFKYVSKSKYYIDLGFWNSLSSSEKLTRQQFKKLSTYDAVASTSVPIVYAGGLDDESPIKKTLEKLEKAAKKNPNLQVKRLKDIELSLDQNTQQIFYANTAYRLFLSTLSEGKP